LLRRSQRGNRFCRRFRHWCLGFRRRNRFSRRCLALGNGRRRCFNCNLSRSLSRHSNADRNFGGLDLLCNRCRHCGTGILEWRGFGRVGCNGVGLGTLAVSASRSDFAVFTVATIAVATATATTAAALFALLACFFFTKVCAGQQVTLLRRR
jgi:hypothetical protein